MNTPDQDKLRQDLEALERRYRSLGADGPPEMLDQAILNSARRAVEAPAARPWSFGWMHATATAALLVLGLTLVLQLRDQFEPEPLQQASPRMIDGLSGDKEGLQESASGARKAQDRDYNEADSVATLEEEAASSRDNAPVAAKQAARRDGADSEYRKTEPSPDGAFGDLRSQPAAPESAPAVLDVDDEAFGQSPDDDAEAARERKSKEDEARQSRIAGRSESSEGEEQASSGDGPQEAGDFRDPEQWLQSIEELLKQGNETGWRDELDKFIAAYPDHPLPDSLEQALQDAGQP